MQRVSLVLGVLALLPSIGAAMEATCYGCSDSCCQWAFAARLALANGEPSIEAYSRETFERYGYAPVPCREVVGDERAYDRCAIKAYWRCKKRLCYKFRQELKWSWSDWIGLGEFPGYDAVNAQLEEERWDEQWRQHNRRGVSGTEPVEFHPGQMIIVEKDGQVTVLEQTTITW